MLTVRAWLITVPTATAGPPATSGVAETATTGVPLVSVDVVPRAATGYPDPSILTTAVPLSGSTPTTRAGRRRPSASTAVSVVAPARPSALVSMNPSLRNSTADPSTVDAPDFPVRWTMAGSILWVTATTSGAAWLFPPAALPDPTALPPSAAGATPGRAATG